MLFKNPDMNLLWQLKEFLLYVYEVRYYAWCHLPSTESWRDSGIHKDQYRGRTVQ